MGLGQATGHPESTGPRSGAADHPHPALRAVERARAPGLEPAVGARQPRSRVDRGQTRLLRLTKAVARREDLLVERAEELVADAIGVAALALAAPPHDRPHDQLAGQLVPMRGKPPDDRVVLRV